MVYENQPTKSVEYVTKPHHKELRQIKLLWGPCTDTFKHHWLIIKVTETRFSLVIC